MDPVRLLQDFQRIYGICPCCGEPFRLSDATLFHRRAPPRTPWDDLEGELLRIQRAEQKLEDDADRLREQAQSAGRREANRRLKQVATFFRRNRIELGDLKLLFHPVDYVVFRGLSDERCTAVELLDREPASRAHERLQRSIQRTIDAGRYHWITMQIGDDGEVNCS